MDKTLRGLVADLIGGEYRSCHDFCRTLCWALVFGLPVGLILLRLDGYGWPEQLDAFAMSLVLSATPVLMMHPRRSEKHATRLLERYAAVGVVLLIGISLRDWLV